MRLLNRTGVEHKLRKENDELIDHNLRLRQYEAAVTHRLNTIKDTYEPEKLARLKEFEEFCQDLMIKKAKLLEELAGIEKGIADKKDVYYSLIARQDELAERSYQIEEANQKLNFREAFVKDLEQRWRNKQ